MSENTEFEKGVRAYEEGDYATALLEFRQLAEKGYAAAQNDLGAMYANGVEVPQDYQEAAQWFHRAAAQGHVRAQYALGVMYKKGEGVPQDAEAAVRWWRRAAEQGHAAAQSNLGVMYHRGEGVPQEIGSGIIPGEHPQHTMLPNTPKIVLRDGWPGMSQLRLSQKRIQGREQGRGIRPHTPCHRTILRQIKRWL